MFDSDDNLVLMKDASTHNKHSRAVVLILGLGITAEVAIQLAWGLSWESLHRR